MYSNNTWLWKIAVIAPFLIMEAMVGGLLYLYTQYYIIDTVEPLAARIVVFCIIYLLFALVQSHFIRCFLTEPGSINPLWSRANLDKVRFNNHSEKERFLTSYPELRASYSETELNMPYQIYSYCAKCKVVKPERAHHCSVCQRCYLKMDHHCPWVGNCVGYRNHKFFLLFLFYTVIASGIMLGTLIDPLSRTFVPGHSYPLSYATGIMISTLFSFSFFFAALIMLIYHVGLITSNMTTIEAHNYSTSPYSQGSCTKNAKTTLGSKARFWLLPTLPKMDIDGHSFVKNPTTPVEDQREVRIPIS